MPIQLLGSSFYSKLKSNTFWLKDFVNTSLEIVLQDNVTLGF